MFGHRPDATLAEGVPASRRFMPFISPRRWGLEMIKELLARPEGL